MRFLIVPVVILVAAVAIGCGPGKELPKEVVRPKEVAGPGADPNGTAPAASDPAAKAVIDRAIKAITVGDPARLAKGKVARVTYQGGVKTSPQASEMTRATRVIETVWPDFALVADDFKGDFPNTTFYLREQHGWLKFGPRLSPGTPPPELGRVVRNDLAAWHWMMLGLPLTDPTAVFFEPNKQPGGTAVKVGLPGRPVYLVTFDEAKGLPVKSEYHPLEHQQRVRKVFTLGDHKPAGDLLLPTKVDLVQDGVPVEQWGQPGWEFPESIDPTRFDPPKQ